MKHLSRRTFLTTALASTAAPSLTWGAPASPDMVQRAKAFLDTLDDGQRKKTTFPMKSEERENWHYVPKSREGIALKELNVEQKKAAFALLNSALSEEGRKKAELVLELEAILAVVEDNPRVRDVGAYYFSVFGTPGDAQGWSWRYEGHHISINITQVGDRYCVTPTFWGANPAQVQEGPLKGVRTLAKEEDVARRLVASLHADKHPAVYSEQCPNEFLTRAKRHVKPLGEEGVLYSAMKPAQQALVNELLQVHVANYHEAIAQQEISRIQKAGQEKIRFAWAGGIAKGERHYYRLQSPAFLVEYVNSQDDANHIHIAWRSFEADYGHGILA